MKIEQELKTEKVEEVKEELHETSREGMIAAEELSDTLQGSQTVDNPEQDK